jgi:hypothetical protein
MAERIEQVLSAFLLGLQAHELRLAANSAFEPGAAYWE